MRNIFAIAVALLAAMTAFAQKNDVPCPPELTEVRAFIEKAIEHKQLPSLAVAVVRNDTTLWAEGFGYARLDTQTKADSDTIYLLASVSKPITATGLMILKDRGLVDLDKPANDYLPNTKLRACHGSSDDITLRRLANHTAGLPTHCSFFYDGIAPPPMDETIRRFGIAVYTPGQRYCYSNLAFGVINYITEVASGEPWRVFMEKNLYDPLGMKGTSDHVRPERAEDAAQIYTYDLGDRFVPVAPYSFDHLGASAIWSSANDLARFCRMHLHNGELDGVRVLSEASAREMRASAAPDISGMGVSWAVDNDRGHAEIAHNGGMPGVRTEMHAYPDDGLVVVTLANSDTSNCHAEAARRIIEILLPGEAEKKPKPDKKEETNCLDAIRGTWRGTIAHFNGDIPVELFAEDADNVSVRFGDGTRQRLDNVGFGNGFSGHTRGTFEVQDSYHGPVDLTLQLEPEGDRLDGISFVTADSYFSVSFWTSLERAK